MASKKRTRFQIEQDRERITSMYLRGIRQVDIADKIGVTQQQVSYDLKAIQKQWRKDTAINLDEAKNRELARIDELEREYWVAWERSKGEKTKQSQEAAGVDKNGQPIVKKMSKVRETMLGNPAYLTGVQWCISERCKLLGIYAAVKQDVNINVSDLSDEELLAIIEE